ncbi:LacI family DNA-binding transcriptional regulator [Nitratireductor sp. ZSWI3]|uniref:LacI family DNA-binding transcriptional regulator n=1 Tax=Nitratireductor sp. ZSWI3 TaxID=2966359 RepID=UPI0021505594|nr:LacI family DNA-binding transcriptional regulator [Nitratireductor sp. ZSWI3]MCR4265941.1 LacI family transcriptional regulator [Nitratireductor sp. ZSWI3]
MKKVTLRDVAREAGVSHGTVSNVFNHPDRVVKKVRERVEAAALKIGYRGPDPLARVLNSRRVNAIGVATAEPMAFFFEDPFASAILAAVSREADARGAGLSLVSAASDKALAWNIGSALVDGFILFCIEGGSRLVELTRKRGLPFVALELGVDDPSIPVIGVDNVAGARLAVDHLAALGHRHLAILSMPFGDSSGSGPAMRSEAEAAEYSSTADRIRGYFEAAESLGLLPMPIYQTRNEEKSVIAALAELYEGQNGPTGLLCMSDRIALIAIEWLRSRGRNVPGDVSVTGFDDIPVAATASPALTTIAQPIDVMGRLAVGMILDGPEETRKIVPTRLIVRDTTGKAPGRA